jgi:hypothetical protein
MQHQIEKERLREEKKNIADFSSINPYQTEMMLGDEET